MKNQLLIPIFFAMAIPMRAQLGITATSSLNRAAEWQVVTENYIVHHRADFLRNGTSGVVDYVFTLKNEAVRLRPALNLMYANSIYHPHYFQVAAVGLQGNVEFALWGAKDKQGRPVPFRPYLQLSPGLSLVNMRYDRPIGDQTKVFEEQHSSSLAPNFGANIFLEIELSDLLSIAPTAGIRYFPGLEWDGFTETVTKGGMTGTYDRTNLRQFNFGLRVGLAFDKK